MEQQFWLSDPSVLMNRKFLFNVWPSSTEHLSAKLNSITRLVIALSIVGYLITKNIKIVISAVVTLAIIIMLHYTQKEKQVEKQKTALKEAVKEGFTNPTLYKATKPMFTAPTQKNPLMNVALPEIVDNPKRKAAAPAFNPAVETEINDNVKKNLDPRLFKDLGDSINFDSSMRNFYATANTQIPNDQKAFAEFCYGNMKSCKERDPIQCEKKNYRWTNP